MSRFENLDTDSLALIAEEGHDALTQQRTPYADAHSAAGDDEAPVINPKTQQGESAACPPSYADPFQHAVRLYFTITEKDALGQAIAKRLEEMPEESRKHFAINKAVREAVLKSIDDIARNF